MEFRQVKMIRKQDLGVLFFYFMGYSRIRNKILRHKKTPITRFVTFHDIMPDDLENFETNMYFLKQYTNVISLNDYFSRKLSTERINVVITFDDGYKSWIYNAIPILIKLELPATFFLSSGFIELSREKEIDFIRSNLFPNEKTYPKISGSLTTEDVKKISSEGFTIGGHTLNHCILSEIHDKSRLFYEIAEDKKRLENITNGIVEFFAYPSGVYQNPNIDIIQVLMESGYKGAVTTVPGSNTFKTNPYLLHRELTGVPMPNSVFKARVYGNYDAVMFIKKVLSVK
jgi:peptidoglycan/xylan/chitin deacetylase (PgdA/CDA1 family)